MEEAQQDRPTVTWDDDFAGEMLSSLGCDGCREPQDVLRLLVGELEYTSTPQEERKSRENDAGRSLALHVLEENGFIDRGTVLSGRITDIGKEFLARCRAFARDVAPAERVEAPVDDAKAYYARMVELDAELAKTKATLLAAENEMRRIGYGTQEIFVFGDNGLPKFTSITGDACWDSAKNRKLTFEYIKRKSLADENRCPHGVDRKVIAECPECSLDIVPLTGVTGV